MIKRIPIKEARRNMLLAEDIISTHGQLLAEAGTLLEDRLLLHLGYYGVSEISIEIDELARMTKEPKPQRRPSRAAGPNPINKENAAAEIDKLFGSKSVVKEVIDRPVFKDFTKTYVAEVNGLKSTLSDFIERRQPLEKEALIKDTQELFQKVDDTSEILMMIYNMRKIDDATYAHSVNVSLVCRIIGTWMNYPEEDLDTLTLCGLLHDVGKSAVPPSILKKPGPLTDHEYDIIKNHPINGHKILKNQKLNKRIKLAALQHHERCDGSGYPYGLTDEEIDPFSMIVAIADVYDAMTANRIYRAGLCPFDVLHSMEDIADGFHPHFLQIFMQRAAEAYVDSDAFLSDDSVGRIIEINYSNISRPKIMLQTGSILDLSKNNHIFIEKVD